MENIEPNHNLQPIYKERDYKIQYFQHQINFPNRELQNSNDSKKISTILSPNRLNSSPLNKSNSFKKIKYLIDKQTQIKKKVECFQKQSLPTKILAQEIQSQRSMQQKRQKIFSQERQDSQFNLSEENKNQQYLAKQKKNLFLDQMKAQLYQIEFNSNHINQRSSCALQSTTNLQKRILSNVLNKGNLKVKTKVIEQEKNILGNLFTASSTQNQKCLNLSSMIKNRENCIQNYEKENLTPDKFQKPILENILIDQNKDEKNESLDQNKDEKNESPDQNKYEKNESLDQNKYEKNESQMNQSQSLIKIKNYIKYQLQSFKQKEIDYQKQNLQLMQQLEQSEKRADYYQQEYEKLKQQITGNNDSLMHI